MIQKFEFLAAAGTRLDVILSEESGLTRSRIAQLIKDGYALVDGQPQDKPGLKLKDGQQVSFTVPAPRDTTVEAQDIPLDILYEDDDLAVVIKPCGMVVHPAAGNEDQTLVNALLYHLTKLSGIGGELRPGIVHRLDKDTSGLLLVAKNDASHLALSQQLQNRQIEKHYRALIEGHLKEPAGQIDAPIGRSKNDRKKMAVTPDGRPSLTKWQVIEDLERAQLIDVHLITGRTHQIRVHMAYLHHPVAGDPIYGLKKGVRVPRLMLHAYSLTFTHPRTNEQMTFIAPLPQAFEAGVRGVRHRPLDPPLKGYIP